MVGLGGSGGCRVRQCAHDQREVGGAPADNAAGASSFVAKSLLVRQYRVEHPGETAYAGTSACGAREPRTCAGVTATKTAAAASTMSPTERPNAPATKPTIGGPATMPR